MTIKRFFGSRGRLVTQLALFLNLTLLAAPLATPTGPQTPDIATTIAFLQPTSPILTVGDMTVTWKDFAPIMGKMTVPQSKLKLSPEQLRQRIRKVLQAYATRGLLLQEARAMKLVVTPEDKAKFESDLELSLKNNSQGITKEKFIQTFKRTESTMLGLSYEDALLLQKLDQIKFSGLKLSQKILDNAVLYLSTINNTIKRQNQARKDICQEILKNPKSKTDKGFSDLVKEYSEGIEAKWGGELRYDFTRKELAAVCYLDRFDFKVGDNTPVCETNSAFRIIRVLREVPQPNVQPAKLRVAQILIGKLPTQDTSRSAVEAKMLKELRKLKIAQFTQELTAKYPVQSLFFPEGLWPKPPIQKAEQPPKQTKP